MHKVCISHSPRLQTCYGLVAALLARRPTSLQQVIVMEFGKRNDTMDTMDFCLCQLLTDKSHVVDFESALCDILCNNFLTYLLTYRHPCRL